MENRASSVMGHVQPICKNVMIDILRCFLQRDDMPLGCDLLLKGIFLPTSRSWIPVVDAESLLHKRTVRQIFVEAVCLRRCIVSPYVLSCKSSHRDNLKGHKCTHFGFQPVTLYETRISKSVSGLVTDQSVTSTRTMIQHGERQALPKQPYTRLICFLHQ